MHAPIQHATLTQSLITAHMIYPGINLATKTQGCQQEVNGLLRFLELRVVDVILNFLQNSFLLLCR